MHVGRSIKVGLKRLGGPNNHEELAKALRLSETRTHHLVGQETVNGSRLQKLAEVFDVKVSEFISWGE